MEALRRVRWVGFLAIAIGAIVVTLVVGNVGADGGQTATWAAKDLLAVIGRAKARESSVLSTKIPVLLLLGILALCWHGVTLGRGVTERPGPLIA